MRLQILLCFLVSFAYASENPAWNDQYHYVYQLRGRSLASLNQISNDYSGVVFKAQLEIQPKRDGNLGAKISSIQYAKVHAELKEGWETQIPDSELNYQELPFSNKPFQITLKNGAIRNVIVSKSMKNWEANMVKSIVSQFQLDTKANNLISSSINMLTQEDSNSAVFKTMEETVTGVSETLYEIHPYPDYVLQSQPWVVPHKHLIEQGEVIEIVKTKNFTHSEQTSSYHAGLEGVSGYKRSNKIGNFMTRSSVTQAVITGTLQKYTIQSAVTVEEIALSPTHYEEQKGSVNSKLNVTLLHVSQSIDEKQFEVESPVEVGVVYGYDNPYGNDNSPRPAKEYDHGSSLSSAESDSSENQISELRSRNYMGDNFEDWQQNKPQLSEAPRSPLLPFTVGYDGQSFKKQQNIVETVSKLAQEIAQDMSHPKNIHREHTLEKLVTLTSLVRIMNANEVRQVADKLHTSENLPSWVVYRDAVAQAGTGPAIYNIKEWILSGKISDLDAALIVATAANSARQPTEEYIKFFNDMMQDKQITSKPYLNTSVILSYTNLIRQVYNDQEDSEGKFPVYSYGSFRTSKGRLYVKQKVIPYLTSQLNEAINNADNQNVHVYIRALGNIGHQSILEAFEPYLEGQRQASHFQRVLMVVALDKFVKSNPRVARSVLYKIYQNPSEVEQVRVAAVYQLMRTEPPADMLQRMAAYTNVDTNDYVNAAVKSCIESASKLEDPQYYQFRVAAESAKPLLTSQEYGVQYSQGYLRTYVTKELQSVYQQYLQFYGGEDHAVPKGIKYNLKSTFGGVKKDIINAHIMVSSVEDLITVFKQQTSEYQHQQQEKQKQDAAKFPWSSEYIAKMLNLENEQREQLEGNLYLQAGALQSILSFDNNTFENLPSVIQRFENELKQGKHSQYHKMMICEESALAFPTVLGLPFIYTYDRPALISFDGKIKATSQPSVSDGQSLQKPETVNAEFNINAVVSGRIHAQLSIFTPFDHQRYSAGYVKNFQVVLPLNGNLEVHFQKQQLKFEIQNPGKQENVPLGHYSSWPYTAQNEIYTPKPELKIIRSQDPYRRSIAFGDSSTGLAMYIEITSDERIDCASMWDKIRHQDFVSSALQSWVENDIQYAHVDLGIDAAKSRTQQIVLRFGYRYDYKENSASSRTQSDSGKNVPDIPDFADDSEKRQMEFLDRLSSHISNVQTTVGDVTVEFQGQSVIKYSLTAGAAKSNVDPRSQFMLFVRKLSAQEPQTLVYVQAEAKVPNTNGLNLDYAMQMDPTSTVYVQGLLSHNQRLSRAEAHVKLSKSNERVEYLKQQREYQECKHQMSKGNTQLPICAKMQARANLLDQFSVNIKYDNMDFKIINATYKVYSVLRHHLYPRFDENIDVHNKNRLDIEGQFSPDLEHVNVSIVSEIGKVELRDAEVSPWAREFLVPHPVFHTRARLQAQILKEDTYRPICVVDKTEINTFDNKTYPASFSNDWTVLLQYVPRRPSSVPNHFDQSVSEQLHQTTESYVVYARASQEKSSEKEVLIVLQMPSTQGKIVKIQMKPSQDGKQPKVLVNDQEVQYDTESSSDYYNAHVQIYGLPNDEVKVEIYDAFYVIFNGHTLKLTAVNSKFRDSTRGLCGTFTGEPETDFLGPDNCIIHNYREFIQSYTAQTSSHSSVRRNAQNQECYQKKIIHSNYISNQDAGRNSENSRRSSDDCTGHITRYVEKNGEICFTIRALPFCKSGCRPLQMKSKLVDVHCLTPSSNTETWKSQIDKRINQDFTRMQPTQKITMNVPLRCLA